MKCQVTDLYQWNTNFRHTKKKNGVNFFNPVFLCPYDGFILQ